MTIIYRQYDDTTRTKIALGGTCKIDCEAGNIINFLKRLHTCCYRSDDGGLSVKLYKQVMSVKSLNNFSNMKPHIPHGFKEELKIKYNSVLAVVGNFPNRTGAMMELLKAKPTPLTWANYYAMSVADQITWKERGDNSTKAMLLLLKSNNDNAKKDLCLLHSQGNKSAYSPTAKVMARYLST